METGQSKFAQRLAEVEQQIEEYRLSLNLPLHKPKNIERFLTNSFEELNGLDCEDCFNVSIELAKYSFFVQQENNKLVSMINWIESNIDWIIADKVGEYKGYSFAERKLAAMKDNDVTQKMEKTKSDLLVRRNYLFALSDKVDKIAKYYNDLGNKKKWSQK